MSISTRGFVYFSESKSEIDSIQLLLKLVNHQIALEEKMDDIIHIITGNGHRPEKAAEVKASER